MDRQLALWATVLCLAAAHGCKRTEHRRASERAYDSRSMVEVNADEDRARPSDQHDPAVQPSPVGDDVQSAPSRMSARRLSPEQWLAIQAAAAWSGRRDRPRPATPPRALSSTVEGTSEDEMAVTDGEEVPPEEASEASSTAVAEAATDEELTRAGSEDETSESEEVVEASEDGSLSSNADEELRRYVAVVYGAGAGYTGVGAGESGYTGMGAGEGYTGIGAGEGFTGTGAGPGFTGMFASIPSETAAPSSSTESEAAAPRPVVVLLPYFVSPWGAYLSYY